MNPQTPDPNRPAAASAAGVQTAGVASPLTLQKILVPIDFSPESTKALKYARAFARHFGAGLVLLHVVEAIVYPGELGYGALVMPDTQQTLQANAKTRLELLAKEEADLSVQVETRVRLGSPFQEITSAAKDEGADLIIIATHGFTGLKHVFLGSTAERVVRYASCPVLSVRVREHELV